mgnify:CR=1 FL=1
MKSLARVLFASAVLLVFAAGCGYHFSGEGEGPRKGLRKIAVPVFDNATSEPDLGSLFAGALRRQFIQKGSLQVTPVEDADVVFHGRVTNIYTSSVAHQDTQRSLQTQLTVEARLYVTLELRAVEPKTGTVVWQDPNFTYWKVFRQVSEPRNPDPMVGYDNRREALQFLADEMAVRIHDRYLSDF